MLDEVEIILLIVIGAMAILSALLYALHLWIQCHRKIPSVHNTGFGDDSTSSRGDVTTDKEAATVETNHNGGAAAAAHSHKRSLLMRVISNVTRSADIDDAVDDEDEKQDDFAVSISLSRAERAQLIGGDGRPSRAGSAISYAEDETDLVPTPIEFRHTRFTPQIRMSSGSRVSSSSSAFACN